MKLKILYRAVIPAVAAFAVSAGLLRAAGAINIRPTVLQLNANSRYTSLALTNTGDAPLLFQVETRAWTQKASADVLTPTQDLIVAPPVLTIEAGTSRVVRVALRGVQPGDREIAYRLIITQVPDQTRINAPRALRFIYQLNVPLFVAPSGAPETRLAFSATLDRHKRRIAVTVDNGGNVHFRLDELHLFGGFAGNVPLGKLSEPSDVLAGAVRTYEVPLQRMPDASSITVEASAGGQTPVRSVVGLTP